MAGAGRRKKYSKKYSKLYNYKPTNPKSSVNPKCKEDEEAAQSRIMISFLKASDREKPEIKPSAEVKKMPYTAEKNVHIKTNFSS